MCSFYNTQFDGQLQLGIIHLSILLLLAARASARSRICRLLPRQYLYFVLVKEVKLPAGCRCIDKQKKTGGAASSSAAAHESTQITRFTSTKVQMPTQEALLRAHTHMPHTHTDMPRTHTKTPRTHTHTPASSSAPASAAAYESGTYTSAYVRIHAHTHTPASSPAPASAAAYESTHSAPPPRRFWQLLRQYVYCGTSTLSISCDLLKASKLCTSSPPPRPPPRPPPPSPPPLPPAVRGAPSASVFVLVQQVN
jgi:hypothetical protein